MTWTISGSKYPGPESRARQLLLFLQWVSPYLGQNILLEPRDPAVSVDFYNRFNSINAKITSRVGASGPKVRNALARPAESDPLNAGWQGRVRIKGAAGFRHSLARRALCVQAQEVRGEQGPSWPYCLRQGGRAAWSESGCIKIATCKQCKQSLVCAQIAFAIKVTGQVWRKREMKVARLWRHQDERPAQEFHQRVGPAPARLPQRAFSERVRAWMERWMFQATGRCARVLPPFCV